MNISPEGGTVVVSPKEEGRRKGLGQIESADNFFEERGCGVCVPYEYMYTGEGVMSEDVEQGKMKLRQKNRKSERNISGGEDFDEIAERKFHFFGSLLFFG